MILCKRDLNFKEPAHRSHPIVSCVLGVYSNMYTRRVLLHEQDARTRPHLLIKFLTKVSCVLGLHSNMYTRHALLHEQDTRTRPHLLI